MAKPAAATTTTTSIPSRSKPMSNPEPKMLKNLIGDLNQRQQQRSRDQHQKIRQIQQGDIVALPTGEAHWCYNEGETPLVMVVVHDTSNNANQLDRNLRKFQLAGSQQSQTGSAYQQQQQQQRRGQQEIPTNNIFNGFDVETLAEAFGVNTETARRLQGQNDQRGNIVFVQEGLQVIRPQRGEEEETEEQYRVTNGVEETICSMRLKQNIANPTRADIYSEKGNAGRQVFNGQLNQGQILVVPQNFAVVKQAGNEGFEWVAFKTNDNAMMSPLVGKTSALRAMPADVLMNAYQISREEANRLKNNRREETMILTPGLRSQVRLALKSETTPHNLHNFTLDHAQDGMTVTKVTRQGSGATATIYRAVCIPTQETVAIKVLDLEKENSELCKIAHEAQTMTLMDQPNLLKAHCSFVTDHHLWVVMPFMATGSCQHIMKTAFPDGFEEAVIATIVREVLKGLVNIHQHGDIHRDVKAGNILMDSRGAIKLCDFGASASLFDEGKRLHGRNTFTGTFCWMAPEVLEQQKGYDFKADIWSFGITALELAHGHAPYSKFPAMRIIMKIIHDAPPGLDCERDKKFSKSFREMIKSCLQKQPHERPSAQKLLKHHPFFKKARSSEYLTRTEVERGELPRYRMSGWNFDVEAIKRQASQLPDGEEEVERLLPSLISNESSSLDDDESSSLGDDESSQLGDEPSEPEYMVGI
ncbi:hypothetical protein C5167_004994 [Papaver somniferum]|uniref:Protein kinase domain-containing protein n=1 Tax=Papaver somniferum TaxID=3469 RepID=A0A4Y7JCF3_PAPSO|nr:hypothetical protein C5167_004994 [Papaver somniferum]